MMRGIVTALSSLLGRAGGLESSDWEAQRVVMVGEQGVKAALPSFAVRIPLPLAAPLPGVEVGTVTTSVKSVLFPSARVIFWEGG